MEQEWDPEIRVFFFFFKNSLGDFDGGRDISTPNEELEAEKIKMAHTISNVEMRLV